MKNAATAVQGTAAVVRALARRAAAVRRRPAPPRRGRAHAPRLRHRRRRAGRLGDARNGLGPADVDYQVLRRWAARLSQSGAAPRTMARKLASTRSLFRSCVEHGEIDANPADLLPAPRLPQTLPRTLKPHDVARLLDRIPAATPLELRDRALFELAYACGLRAEELVDLDVGSHRLRRRAGARRGQGRQDPLRARRRARAEGRSARYLERGRARAGRAATRSPALFLSKTGRRLSTSDVRRRLRVVGAPRRDPGRASTRTRSGTRSRPTCWRAARTCARSRSCLATQRISTTQVYTRVESARLRAAYAKSHPRA